MSKYDKAIFCDPTQCHGGMLAPSQVGRSLAETYQYWRMYRRHGMLCRYVGIAASDYCGFASNYFYIISPVVSDVLTKKIGIVARRWNYDDWTDPGGGADYENDVDWNGSQLDSETVLIRAAYDSGSIIAADVNSAPPSGPMYRWIADSTQSTLDAQYDSGYRYDLLSVPSVSFAYVMAMQLPPFSIDNSNNRGLPPGNFAAQSTIRGYDAADSGTSLGALIQYEDLANDGILQNTKQCVVSYMHPAGTFVIGAGAAAYLGLHVYDDGAGTLATVPLSVRGRNLRGRSSFGTDNNLDIVMVAQWDTGVSIKVTSQELSISRTHSLGASTAGTPTLIVFSAGAIFDPRGDKIEIEFEVSSTAGVIVHALSLYETTGDYV